MLEGDPVGRAGFHKIPILQPVEAHAADGDVLTPSSKAVGLDLQNPLGEAVWILAVGRMLLVYGEVVIGRQAGINPTNCVDTRSEADLLDAQKFTSQQHVVAAHGVVLVNLGIWLRPGARESR